MMISSTSIAEDASEVSTMDKFVVSNVDDTLGKHTGDDGSIVLCAEHLAKFRKIIPDGEGDRVFNVKLFPGGEALQCEECEMPGPLQGDPFAGERRARAADLLRLTVHEEFKRLRTTVARLATLLTAMALVLAFPLVAKAVTPYVGSSWLASAGLGFAAYFVVMGAIRWITGTPPFGKRGG
jgi:hypothetical protein